MLLALLLAAATACREAVAPRGVWRAIEQAPAAELYGVDLLQVRCSARFTFAGDDLPPGVSVEEGTVAREPGSGLVLRGGSVAPRVRLDVPPADGRPWAVLARIEGVRGGKAKVRWNGGDAKAAATVGPERASGSLRSWYTFYLPARPEAVDSVLLEPTTAPGEMVALREVCVGPVALSRDKVAAAARRPWKVTLEDDTRDALVQPPDGPVARDLGVRAGARLELGVGAFATTAAQVDVEILARKGDEGAVTLLERRLDAAELERWVDLSVDLSALAPGDVTFSWQATPVPADAELVALWSHPLVTRPGGDHSPNIVLVSVDTLRADRLSLYGNSRPTSPRIDRWARERGWVFRNAFAPSGWTLPSHFSLLTGLHPTRHPANHRSAAFDSSRYVFLAEKLWQAGYRTQAYTAGGFVRPVFGLAQGFEGFSFRAAVDTDNELAANLAHAHQFLDHAPEPFFLFFHTYEPHTPNPPRQPWFSRFSSLPATHVVDWAPDEPSPQEGFVETGHYVLSSTPGGPPEPVPKRLAALPLDAYDSAVAFLDDRLGSLLERLAKPPFADDTVVVLLSDHGESFGESGRFGHALHDVPNLRVPLVLAIPGRAARQVAAQVRLQDVFPTLLELAGANDTLDIDAESLLPFAALGSAPPRTVVSYAARSNLGVGVLSPSGLRLEWRNSVWGAIAGTLRWSRVDGYQETGLPEQPRGAEAERLLRLARRAYAEGPGLDVVVTNETARSLAVRLFTDLIDPVTAKASEPGGPRLVWKEVGRLEEEIAAAGSLRLRLERFHRPDVSLRVEMASPECRSPSHLVVEESAAQLARGTRREVVLCDDLRMRAGVSLRWIGPVPAGPDPERDPGAEEQLRALGYID